MKASIINKGDTLLESLLKNYIITDVNAPDEHGKTLLRYTGKNDDAESMKILVERKDVDVNLKDKNSVTPLHCAAKHDHAERVQLLLAYPFIDVNAQRIGCNNFSIYTSLHLEAKEGHAECARLLLANKDININP